MLSSADTFSNDEKTHKKSGVFFTKSSKRHEPNFSGEPKNLFLRVISLGLLIDI